MDLHDEVGSGLSQIALWSEVLRDDSERGRPHDPRWLERISSTSGALVDALGDVVWSIDPRRDRLGDLVNRMRRFLEEGALARSVAFSFVAPEGRDEVELPPEPRRHLWLAFKEGVHNAFKHSEATHVEVRLVLGGRSILLTIADDGVGFDAGAEHPGTGVSSLRRRAVEAGGRLEIESAPGAGTRVTLRVPLR
jgi:signal transduction histidine kinase